MELNSLWNFGRGGYDEHVCEIISSLDQWLRRHYFFYKFPVFSCSCHFVQLSRTICAILVESNIRNILVEYFKFRPVAQKVLFDDCSISQLWWPICSTESDHLGIIGLYGLYGLYEIYFCETFLN